MGPFSERPSARVQTSGRVLTWGWRGCTCCPRTTSSTKDRDGFLWATAARGQPSVVEGEGDRTGMRLLYLPHNIECSIGFASRFIDYRSPKTLFLQTRKNTGVQMSACITRLQGHRLRQQRELTGSQRLSVRLHGCKSIEATREKRIIPPSSAPF